MIADDICIVIFIAIKVLLKKTSTAVYCILLSKCVKELWDKSQKLADRICTFQSTSVKKLLKKLESSQLIVSKRRFVGTKFQS